MPTSELIGLLAESGWNACDSVREGIINVGLAVPTADYLVSSFPPQQWEEADRVSAVLADHFRAARFADQVTFGVVLVPDPARLDTRGAMHPAIRRDQDEIKEPDFVDGRLPDGALAVGPGPDWTLVATVISSAGISLGSYCDIREDAPERYTVCGTDTRELMARQVWGARVLQSGSTMPDSNARGTWTFTIFPGEELTEGQAPSGTVLHGRVRIRLGRPDRGIASARVCPAVVIR